MSENSNGSIVPGMCAAFTVGALLGAGLAILYAPKSGQETRELLSKKAHDLKEAAADAIGRGKQLAGEVRHQAGEVIEKGKHAAHEIGQAARAA